ncbi:MAG: racemase [Chloroflexi bacterium]|nr:MAG: racemase [Chloroflexota bacterium]
MRTIGMISGLSWKSSADYYQLINETIQEKLGGVHTARSREDYLRLNRDRTVCIKATTASPCLIPPASTRWPRWNMRFRNDPF